MNFRVAAFAGAAALLACATASAHISIPSGPAFADQNRVVTFAVGHGCAGADTYTIRIEIPAAVASARALPSSFGAMTVEKDEAGLVTAVTWQRADDDLLDDDTGYYEVRLRFRVPDAPFTLLHFPVYQTCKTSDGTTTTEWVGTDGHGHSDEGPEPAPALTIVPARSPGWNRITVPVEVTALDTYFSDAAIVWRGTAAWSPNPVTTEQIANTEGVTALESLAAGDEIWVRY